MTRRHLVRVLFGLVLVASLALLVGWPAAASGGPGSGSAPAALAQGEPSPTPNACPQATPTPVPTATPVPPATAVPTPHPNLCPAKGPGSPGFDPLTGLLVWAFTPIFQLLFLGLAAFYALIGDIGISIILLTITLRILLVPLFRTQIVSTRRMQMLQPELKALQQRFKGDRARISQEQMRLYRERGVSPTAGCLPAILQLGLLLPMYQVIREGLQAPIIDPMLSVFGTHLINVVCYAPTNPLAACINPTVHWLLNLDAAHPEVILWIQRNLDGTGFGLSILALISALLQLVQTRMVTPQTSDPQQRAQQRTFLFLPLISLVYGGFLPAGLFLYWIATTIFSIAQQYLIVGWGSLFPIFGWTPPFAVDHSPRFPVTAAAPSGSGSLSSPALSTLRGSLPLDRAAGTVRPSKQRGRTSRRGRRR